MCQINTTITENTHTQNAERTSKFSKALRKEKASEQAETAEQVKKDSVEISRDGRLAALQIRELDTLNDVQSLSSAAKIAAGVSEEYNAPSNAEWDMLMKEAYNLASKTLVVTHREVGQGAGLSFILPSDYQDKLSELAKKHIDVFNLALDSFRNIISHTTSMKWKNEDEEYYAKIAATTKDNDVDIMQKTASAKDNENIPITELDGIIESSLNIYFAKFSNFGEGYVNRFREMWSFGFKQTMNSFTDLSKSSAQFLNGTYNLIMKKFDNWQE